MKTTNTVCFCIFSGTLAILVLFSCRKEANNPDQQLSASIPDTTAPLQAYTNQSGYRPFPQKYSMNCSGSPTYGDSLIYPSASAGNSDYLISPVNNPAPGNYYSWPVGLVLNDSTGTIDITKSETGMRYYIGYVRKGSQDTCLSSLIIAGSGYIDSIYSQSSNNRSIVNPYFNANSSMNNLCDQDGRCIWDLSHNAAEQKIWIDDHTGIIDLDKTLENGAFGQNPADGTTLNATIYYRLGDGSDFALQSLQIQLMYFTHSSTIPPDIQAKIQTRRQQAMSNGILDSGPSSARPPIIIITRSK